MNKREVWELAHQIMRRLNEHYVDAMGNVAISLGLESSACFLVIIPAYLFEPDPISPARLRMGIPYNSPAYYEEPLQAVKKVGFLDEVPEGGYVLNQRGYAAFRRMINTAYQQMEQLSPLLLVKLDELKLLLARLVQASILSPEHIGKWNVLHSRRLDPGRNVASLIKVDQYLSDLSAYRDDAHLASWSSYLIDAHAWDILGLLWQGQALSRIDILDSVKKRRWTDDETQEAINELVNKGWVMDEGKLTINEEGRRVRIEAEELTDNYFFSPWCVLTDVEFIQLCESMTRLDENLAKLKPG